MAENFSVFTSEIKKQLSQELSIQGGAFTQDFIDTIKLKVSLYLLEAKQIMSKFDSELQLYQIYNNKDMSVEYKRWLVAKRMISLNIEDTLKQGYELIDELRTAITGQELKYYVGVIAGRGKNRQLYEGYLNLSQILSMAKLESIWKNTANSVFKLRLNARIGELQKSLQPASGSHQSLYGHVLEYASVNKIKNQGNIFEAYRIMAASGVEWDSNEFDEKVLDTFIQVRSNTASFAKGGDYLDESIKFFGGSSPSLASLSTIIQVLENFIQALSLPDINSVRKGLSLLFEKDPIQTFVANDFNNFGNEELEKLFEIFKQT